MLLPSLARSAPTDLDSSFATGGKLLSTIGAQSSLYSVVIQPDGKIIAVGQATNAAAQTVFATVRYLPDGRFDTSFGSRNKGIVTEPMQSAAMATDVALQSDGKIVVVGEALVNSGEFIVVRYLPDGKLDASFANTGKVIIPVTTTGKTTHVNAVAIQSDGKIVVVGSSDNSNTNLDVTLVRYQSNGSLDAGFGNGGKMITSISAGIDRASDVVIQADGKIVVGGSSSNGNYDDFALLRYNSDGKLDNGFGNNGIVTLPAGKNGGQLYALAIQNDGRIIAAGMSHNGTNQNFAVIRLQSNGTLDNSFGGGNTPGKVVVDFGAVDSSVYSLAIESNGNLLLGGYGDKSPGASLFALAQLSPDGILDTTFGNNGKILTDLSPPNLETINRLVIQSDGKIIAAGTSRSNTDSQFALVRYMGSPPAKPELEVRQAAGVSLPNNSSFDFGITSQSIDTTKQFVVTNQGNAPLTLAMPLRVNNDPNTPNAFSSSGSFTLLNDVGNASTVSATSLMLSVGATAAFTVKLSGQTIGTYQGSVSFTHNDTEHNPYNLTLMGQVTTDKIAKMEVWDGANLVSNGVTQVDLGSILQGQPLSKMLVIKNIGNTDLLLSNPRLPPGFQVNGAFPTKIPAGASIAFAVQLDGVIPGLYADNLQFDTNDSTQNPFTFELKGFIAAMGQTTPLGVSQLEVSLEASQGAMYLPGDLGRIDFGITHHDGVLREIVLHNMGDTPLQTGALVLPTGFNLQDEFPSVIAPNSKVAFHVEFKTKEGSYSGALTFKSSDVKRKSVMIYLTGIASDNVPTAAISSSQPPLSSNGMIEDNRFNQGGIATDVKIMPTGSITGGNLGGDIKNQGLIANVNINPNAMVDGGKISGFNVNQGTLCNMEVSNYAHVEGGVYCGNVLNQGTISDAKIQKDAFITGEGMLTGTVQNEGTMCGMHLEAGAQVIGGQLGCNIKGNAEAPAIISKAQIQADATLENVCLTRSVVMSSNVTVGSNVTVNNASSEPIMQDYCIAPQQVPAFDDKRVQATEKEAFKTFDAPNVAVLPDQAAAGFSSEQMGEFRKDALMGFKPEQFKQIPQEALSGLTKDNVGGFQAAVLRELTVDDLDRMQPEALRETKDFAKIATNVDNTKVKSQNFTTVLPQNWEMDETTGQLHPPPGSKIAFKAMSAPELSAQVEMPTDMPDFSSSLAVGGRAIAGETVVEKLNQTLNSQGFKEYSLKQSSSGIVRVEGSSSSKNVSLALLPDSDDMQQLDSSQQPAGVSVDKTGRYSVVTADGWQIPMVPAPQDASDLATALGSDSQVKVGKKGDVLLSYTSTQRRGRANTAYVYVVVIFDPFIDPSLQDFCNASGCDWNNMPSDSQLGINFSSTRAKQQVNVVYSQGKAQKAYPTVLEPDTFINEAKKFGGVEAVTYNTDGSFTLLYQGQTLHLYPSLQVTAKKLGVYETVKPSLILKGDGTLEYSVQSGDVLLTTIVSIGT
jgi:uncharacterized delta-60 repeat protein